MKFISIAILLLLLALFIVAIASIWRHGRRSMKSLLLTNLIVTVPFILCSIRMGYRPGGIIQLILPLLLIIMIAMLIVNLKSLWAFGTDNKGGAILVILLSIACFFSPKWGNDLWMFVFEKRLPQYESAVEDCKLLIQDEHLVLRGEEIPSKYRHLAYSISCTKDESENIEIAFLWGYGFPLKHSAFCYRSDGEPSGKSWPLHKKINDNWFRVSD